MKMFGSQKETPQKSNTGRCYHELIHSLLLKVDFSFWLAELKSDVSAQSNAWSIPAPVA